MFSAGRKATATRQAWSIVTSLTYIEIKSRLDTAFGNEWTWGDSAIYGDYLAGRLTPEAVARIYEVGNNFLVELRFYSTSDKAADEFAAARQVLVERMLPAIEASDVQDAATMD